ncbi:hypothetical protein JTE90_021578 [Oedothorax gibbosus]|uniref:Serine protease HTRA2, mitochondrial n=1 Tax=Oedothorax gibbosus TaxID=931172 RepID=A0AAV6VNW6_9ARAC|nr:hypothetical protein JTE90_021578 [Oedothorax gibbosus]
MPQLSALEETNDKDTFGNESVSPRLKFNFLADIADKTAPAVVYVEIIGRDDQTGQRTTLTNGSGFIVKSDGLILTNAHVVGINGNKNVIVKLFDGREFEGVVEHFDTQSDLATVRIQADNLPVLPLGQSSNIRTGEFVIAMGNPLTLSHTITAGIISSSNRQGKDLGLNPLVDYIQTDAAVNAGNSGGPLVNLDCEAIGINTMKITEGISFAIPSDRAIEFLKRTESIEKGSWNPFGASKDGKKQKYLGVTMLTLNTSIIRELQERIPDFPSVTHGVMVWRIMRNSPSYESGIKQGDVITTINVFLEFSILIMGDKNEYLKEILPTTGLLFQEEFQSFVLSKPKLIPLKSVTLQKLEHMQQEAEKKAKEQMSKASETGD